MVLVMFAQLRTRILKYRTLKLMMNTTRSMLFVNRYKLRDSWFSDCSSYKFTPEETILYLISETCIEADSYYDCEHLKFGVLNDVPAEGWFYIARKWRGMGLVDSDRLERYISTLDAAKSRWPEIFNGQEPFVKKYWEVHFDYVPAGVATVDPATKPIAMFDEFSDATKYVEDHSAKEYWWHSYDLFEAARNKKVPEWKTTPTPQRFNRIDEPGYIGYNSIWHTSADCVFATPRDSYMKWMNAVIEDDIYRVNEVRNGYIYNYIIDVGSWCVRYVEHEEPIDNQNSNANIPDEYLVER